MQLAGAAPELHNMHEVYRDMYEAIGVTDVDRLMKKVPDEEPRPTDPASENINALDMTMLTAFQGQNHQAHILAHLVFASSPMVGGLPPVAMTMQKHVMEHVKLQAEEQAMAQMQQSGPMAVEQQKMQLEALVAQGIAAGMQQVKQLSAQVSGQGPDPLVKLKEQELQIKAQSEQADAQLDQAKLQLDAQNQQMRSEQFEKRLASQEAQTAARIDSALQRELLKQRD
jgi:septal ring factor EnvC (AmiA/AmiB activator)